VLTSKLMFKLKAIGLRFPKLYSFYQENYHFFWKIFLGRYYESEFKYLPQLLGDKQVFFIVDIGSNVGASVSALSRVTGCPRFTCFEPNPKLAEKLKQMYRKSNLDITVNRVALTQKDNLSLLHIPCYRGVEFHGLATLYPRSIDDFFNSKTLGRNWNPSHLHVRKIEVKGTPLDSFELNPDFIKIDVEGAEEDVIIGAIKTLRAYKPILFIECNSSFVRISNTLSSLGYTSYELINKRWCKSKGINRNQVFLNHE